MSLIKKILDSHKIKNQVINSPQGLLIMADNGDGTYTSFKWTSSIIKVRKYLGY